MGDVMKIRVKDALPGTWYYRKVGEDFIVLESTAYGYLVDHTEEDEEGARYYVGYKDAEVIAGNDVTSADMVDQPAHDFVNSPSHYQNAGRFETIEMIEEITKGYDDGYVSYCVGNALKYLARAPYKHGDPTEDLSKAAKYIEFATEYLGRKVDE